MSSSLYKDHFQNSQSAPGNGITTGPTHTLTHYGVNFTPPSLHVTSGATPDYWPPAYDTGYQGPDNTPTETIADHIKYYGGNWI